jgi:hypothetical protein
MPKFFRIKCHNFSNEIQGFTKVERIPENRGAGPSAPAALFSGLSCSFRDPLKFHDTEEG